MEDLRQLLNYALTLIFCLIPYIAFMLYIARKGIAARRDLARRIREARKSGKLEQLANPRNSFITRLLALGALLVLLAFLTAMLVVSLWPTLITLDFVVIVLAVLLGTGIAIGVALYRITTRML